MHTAALVALPIKPPHVAGRNRNSKRANLPANGNLTQTLIWKRKCAIIIDIRRENADMIINTTQNKNSLQYVLRGRMNVDATLSASVSIQMMFAVELLLSEVPY